MENYLANAGNYYHMDFYQVMGVYLKLNNGDVITSVGLSDSIKKHIESEVLPKYREAKVDSYFSDPFNIEKISHSPDIFVSHSNYEFCYVSQYKNHSGISGSLVIISSYDSIIDIFKPYSKENADFLLLNSENKPIFPGKSMDNIKISQENIFDNLNSRYYYLQTYHEVNNGLLSIRCSLYSGWKLVRYISENALMKPSKNIFVLNMYLIIACFTLYLLVTVPFLKRSLSPLKRLMAVLKEYSKGNFSVRVYLKSGDEIEELGNSFNYMAGELEKHIEELIEHEKKAHRMRYSLLISQIDPHFIYNTMNTITYLASNGRMEEVIIVNKAIINILKDRLRVNNFEVYDTIRREIDTVKDYLTIQSYRYKDMFDVKWDVDKDVLELEIPKNIIQPLVENSLYHGLLTNKDDEGGIIGGIISISIKRDKDYLSIRIADNGRGISKEQQDILNKPKPDISVNNRGNHIGLDNVRGRLNYLYGGDYRLELTGKEEQGTEVTITIKINMDFTNV